MQEWLFVLLSGYGIGLFGSFHCIGMCGPIALSLPIHQFQPVQKIVSVLFYNFGRSISYAIFGMLFGLIGSTFTFFKIQQFLSIFSGILLLLLFLNQRYGKVNFSIFYLFTSKIKNQLGVYLKSEKSVLSYLFIGVLNGFLPCGLVYVAIAAAIQNKYHDEACIPGVEAVPGATEGEVGVGVLAGHLSQHPKRGDPGYVRTVAPAVHRRGTRAP